MFWFYDTRVLREIHSLIRVALNPHLYQGRSIGPKSGRYISGLHRAVERIATAIRDFEEEEEREKTRK